MRVLKQNEIKISPEEMKKRLAAKAAKSKSRPQSAAANAAKELAAKEAKARAKKNNKKDTSHYNQVRVRVEIT